MNFYDAENNRKKEKKCDERDRTAAAERRRENAMKLKFNLRSSKKEQKNSTQNIREESSNFLIFPSPMSSFLNSTNFFFFISLERS